jgi:hypothetical protein
MTKYVVTVPPTKSEDTKELPGLTIEKDISFGACIPDSDLDLRRVRPEKFIILKEWATSHSPTPEAA